jgi:hypothetical protein
VSETGSTISLVRRRRRILRAFDKRASHFHRGLEWLFDSDSCDDIVAAARSKLEELAGEIPYAGRDRHPLASSIVIPYTFLCVCLILRERGATTEEIGAFVHASYEAPFSRLPQWLLRPVRRPVLWLTFRRLAAAANASQRHEHAGEFVFSVPTPPHGGDFAMEVRECAVCRAFAKHGEQSVVPYICATDDLASDAFRLGLRRTGTLALGAERCDFVYEFDGKPLRLEEQYDLAHGNHLTAATETGHSIPGTR